MGKIQICRNGCEMWITVQQDPVDDKWKPYDVTPDGQVLDLHQCPNSPYNQGQQTKKKGSFPVSKVTSTYESKATTTQGGESLDTKRILTVLKEFNERLMVIEKILNERTIIDTNKYEGWNNELYNALRKQFSNKGTPASELLKAKDRQDIIVNHAEIADKNVTKQQTRKYVSEDDDPDYDPMADEDMNDEDDDDYDDEETKGVRTDV